MEEIELGEQTWDGDFQPYEMLIPLGKMTSGQSANYSNSGNNSTNLKEINRRGEVYWCKNYQTGTCELSPPPHDTD